MGIDLPFRLIVLTQFIITLRQQTLTLENKRGKTQMLLLTAKTHLRHYHLRRIYFPSLLDRIPSPIISLRIVQ